MDSSNKVFPEKPFSVGVLFIAAEQMYIVPQQNSANSSCSSSLWNLPLNQSSNFSEHVGVVTPHNAQRIALGDNLSKKEPYFSADEQQRIKEKLVLRERFEQ